MFSKEDIKNIEAGFRDIYKKNYTEEKLTIFWMIFPKGYAYSERKASNATVILVEVNDDITTAKREELMSLYSQFLLNNYHVSPLDSIITVANSSWVDRFFDAQQKRVHPMYRPWIKLKTLFTALSSKWTNGFLRLRVRY
jgi:hypothetical protein